MLRLVSAALLLVMSSPAAAHMIITSHETRDGRSQLKDGPCGLDGSTRGDVVHVFEAGSVIELRWDEFVPHPGYYRIAFDEDGQDDFVDPADYDDFYTNDAVVIDNLFPHERDEVDGEWLYELTLPDVACDNCTLQLVQMMTDKPPYVVGTNDLYYNCLDLVLTATADDVGPAPDVGEDVGADVSDDVGDEDTGAEDAGSDAAGAEIEEVGPDTVDSDAPADSTAEPGDAAEPGDLTDAGEDFGPLVTQPATGCASTSGQMSWLGLLALFAARRRSSPT